MMSCFQLDLLFFPFISDMIRSRSVKKLHVLNNDISSETEEDNIGWLSTRARTRTRTRYLHCKRIFNYLFLLALSTVLVLLIQNTVIARQIASLVSFLHSKKTLSRKLQPSGRPPLVDRKILEKLENLAISDLDIEPLAEETTNIRSWPPRVTQIPEQHPFDVLPNLLTPIDFEKQSCSLASIDPITSSCRFILPLWISEQESKARIHLLQLLQLARSLNRTLVLPNVGKSRLGTCLKWEFGVYYNERQFLSQIGISSGHIEDGDDIDVVSMDSFKSWMNDRLDPPVGQIISVNWSTPSQNHLDQLHPLSIFRRKELDVYVHHNLIDPSTQFKRARCLSLKFNRLDFIDTFSPLSIVFTTHSRKSLENGSLAQALVNELREESNCFAAHRRVIASNVHGEARYNDRQMISEHLDNGHLVNDHIPPSKAPDVLIVNWDLRLPLFPTTTTLSAPLATLNYSQRLQALTTRLTKQISPYLAVHWRMESVSPEVLPTCAENLVSTLHYLLNENDKTIGAGINHVWLATDISLSLVSDSYREGTVPTEEVVGSGTFKILTEDHIQALQTLRDAFSPDYGGILSRFKLIGLRDELERMKRNGEEIDNLVDGNSRQEEVLDDSGVLGILDKLVAMRSTVFVSGGNGCGRVRYVLGLFCVCVLSRVFYFYFLVKVLSQSRL
jgi:GDP-fucose protein O-fucosyltransferase